MPLILNIETSSPVCSVCLSKGETLLDFREDKSGNSHAKILTVFIDDLFKSNNILLSELDAVAVSAGPGSYTGLRIGTSVAKGLCYALNKPLIAVPTLLSLAVSVKEKAGNVSGFYMPVMDARRMDAYVAVYDAALNEVRAAGCVTLNDEFANSLTGFDNIFIGGNASEKCKSAIESPNFIYTEKVDCDARSMVRISNNRYLKNEFEDTAYFEPFYLKEFPAKTNS